MTGTPLPKERSEADACLDWFQSTPGEFLPGSDLDNVPVERIRLPDKKGRERTSMYFNALLDVCSREAAGPVVAQLLSNLPPAVRPWIEQLNRAGIATVYSLSQFPAWSSKPAKRWLRGDGYRRVYDAFDCLVTNSPAIEAFLREIGVTTRIEYIPNGVNLARFQPVDSTSLEQERAAIRASLGIPPDHRVIATVGAVMPRKGSDLAVEAWQQTLQHHPNTHLLFIGPRSDQYDPKLAGFSRRITHLVSSSSAPAQVHFSGVVDDVESLLRASDVFVLPTKREGTPNSVLEAMATGLPVVVTRYMGLSDAIGNPGEHYQLVERNAQALGDAISALLSDPAACERWRYAGLAYIRKHMDQQVTLDRYAALYQELGAQAVQRAASNLAGSR